MSLQGRGRVETRALEATAGFPDVTDAGVVKG
jgi:hypothetical protein